MLEQAAKLRLIDIAHLTILYQCNKKPESKSLATVQQQLSHDEVHSLNVFYLLLIVWESDQNSAQLFVSSAIHRLHEVMVSRESTAEVTLYLS